MPSTRNARLAALLAVALPFAALATTVVAATIEEMTQAVPVVVRGTVGPVQAAWDPEAQRIWTYAEVKVTEALKGAPGRMVLVKQPGGEVAHVGMHVDGVARFTEGQDTVLFLEPALDERGTYVIYAMAAGKVDLETSRGQAVALRHLDGLVQLQKGSRDIRPVGSDGEQLGGAEAFLARVRAAAKGGAK